MVLGIPPLEDVDPAGKKRIGHLYKVKAPSRLTGLANNVCVRGKKGCSVYRIKDQAAGDDQLSEIRLSSVRAGPSEAVGSC